MEDPPDVINGKHVEERTPELTFDELMYEKLLKRFIGVLNEKRKLGYNEFEKFIQDLHPKSFTTTSCFKLYDSIRKCRYLYSYSFMDELKATHIFKESFTMYMNAKKSKIIDDLIKRYV